MEVRVPSDVLEAIDDEAARLNTTRAAVVRRVLIAAFRGIRRRPRKPPKLPRI